MKQLIISIMLLLSCNVAIGQSKQENHPHQNNKEALQKMMMLPMRKLQIAEFAITNLYVDSLDENKVVEDAIKGMLKELDPHSAYTPAKDVERVTENLNGGFEGIGVQYNMLNDTLVVIQPVTNGPSEKKGIIAGDRIVTVNDTAIAGVKMSREEIMRRLRGPKGTKVRLGVVRNGVDGVSEFVIERDKIPVYTIDAAYMIDKKTGYIRIGSFGATTYKEFMEDVNEFLKKGMDCLVLDLQENGGGYLNAAVQIAGEMLSKNDLIVYTDGRTSGHHEYRARGNGKLENTKLIVLVDDYSASEAEIVAGAIQDNDRGTVVGRRTFGKGLVQRPIDLPDGSMIRLTVAHYYTPAGRCIQKPYTKGDRKAYDKDMLDRLNMGDLSSVDSIHFADSLKYKTLRLGRTVYGGGGIMPDVFVPLDTMQYTKLHRELAAKSCIIGTALKYVDNNRKKLHKKYKTFEPFKEKFEVGDDIIKLLTDEAKKAKVGYTDSTLNAALPQLRIQLKALIARDLWDMDEYFQIFNPSRDIYRRAMRVRSEELGVRSESKSN